MAGNLAGGLKQGLWYRPLSSLPFYVEINDVTIVRHSTFHLYADDLQIYSHFTISDMCIAVGNTNSDINAISVWPFRHGLQRNKTKTMLLGSPRQLCKIDLNTAPRPLLNDQPLMYCEQMRNLAHTMSKHLQ